MVDQEFDAAVAAWSREQNRGVPRWEDLEEFIKQWWRERYTLRTGIRPKGKAS